MELVGFLLGAIAIAFVIAKVIFSSKAKTHIPFVCVQTDATETFLGFDFIRIDNDDFF